MKSLLIKTYCNYLLLELSVINTNICKQATYEISKKIYTKIGLEDMVNNGLLRRLVFERPIEQYIEIVKNFKKHQDIYRFYDESIDLMFEQMQSAYQAGVEATTKSQEAQVYSIH